jgi:spermidine synthase
VVDHVESAYADLEVLDHGERRYLLIDGGTHTIVRREDDLTLHPYAVVVDLARELFGRNGDMLLLGLGGGSLAQSYARAGWQVDAVEIDPAVIGLAVSDFGLKPFHARVTRSDARRYLERTPARYDLIVFDVFSSGSIPFHLVTREAFALARQRLAPGGVVAVNVEAVGWHHPLVHAVGATLARSFRHVVALPIAEPPDQLGNVVLLAADRPLEIPDARLGDPVAALVDEYDHWRVVTQNHAWDNRFPLDAASGVTITDDRNPADLWSEGINLVARRKLRRYFAGMADAVPGAAAHR